MNYSNGSHDYHSNYSRKCELTGLSYKNKIK